MCMLYCQLFNAITSVTLPVKMVAWLIVCVIQERIEYVLLLMYHDTLKYIMLMTLHNLFPEMSSF